jgi:CRISPR/Cas system-associated exonuclease Cas4 (RecB family)
MTTKTKTLLTGLLIDPYKKRIEEIQIAHDLHVWYDALRCNAVDVVCVSTVHGFERKIDIWIDDEGLLHEPQPPVFRLNAGQSEGGHRLTLAGYGLVLASDGEGETVSLPKDMTRVVFARYTGLQFETWENRLRPEHCISQVMRSIELELPGRFKYLNEA